MQRNRTQTREVGGDANLLSFNFYVLLGLSSQLSVFLSCVSRIPIYIRNVSLFGGPHNPGMGHFGDAVSATSFGDAYSAMDFSVIALSAMDSSAMLIRNFDKNIFRF